MSGLSRICDLPNRIFRMGFLKTFILFLYLKKIFQLRFRETFLKLVQIILKLCSIPINFYPEIGKNHFLIPPAPCILRTLAYSTHKYNFRIEIYGLGFKICVFLQLSCLSEPNKTVSTFFNVSNTASPVETSAMRFKFKIMKLSNGVRNVSSAIFNGSFM